MRVEDIVMREVIKTLAKTVMEWASESDGKSLGKRTLGIDSFFRELYWRRQWSQERESQMGQ